MRAIRMRSKIIPMLNTRVEDASLTSSLTDEYQGIFVEWSLRKSFDNGTEFEIITPSMIQGEKPFLLHKQGLSR
jgi:hypothetical protein